MLNGCAMSLQDCWYRHLLRDCHLLLSGKSTRYRTLLQKLDGLIAVLRNMVLAIFLPVMHEHCKDS